MGRERREAVFFDVANYSSSRARLHSISFIHRFVMFCCCLFIGMLVSMMSVFVWQWRALQQADYLLSTKKQQYNSLFQSVSLLRREVAQLGQGQQDIIQSKKKCSLQDIIQACSLYHLTCKYVKQKNSVDIIVGLGGSFDGLFSFVNHLADTYQIFYQHVSLSYDLQSKYLNATLLVRI